MAQIASPREMKMIAVDRQACDGCGLCIESCPTGALELVDGLIRVDASLCDACYACVDVCPQAALVPTEIVEEARHIPAPSSSGESRSSGKLITRPTITDLDTRGSGLGDWLGAALEFLVYDLGPAIEGIIRTQRHRKGGDAISFRSPGEAQGEKRGRRVGGRKSRRRRRGRR